MTGMLKMVIAAVHSASLNQREAHVLTTSTATERKPVMAAVTASRGVSIDCGDGIACTVDSCDEVNDTCANTPDNRACDDGQYCDGVETCDLISGCEPGTAVECSDGIACTNDSCDETSDRCVFTPEHNNYPDDGIFCNGDEFCHPQNDCSSRGDPCLNGTVCDEDAGSCGPPPSCGDGIADQGEACDDGNTESGDCCSADCQFETEGSSCSAISTVTERRPVMAGVTAGRELWSTAVTVLRVPLIPVTR